MIRATTGTDGARDPALGWGAALAFASVFPGAGALLGVDIVRVYVFWLGLLALLLAVIGSIGTLYERAACSSNARRRAGDADAGDGDP